MSAPLPDCDEVFSKFFDRWYDDEDRQRKGFTHTRPDMMLKYRCNLAAADLCNLTDAGQKKVFDHIATMQRAAQTDWARYLPVTSEINMDWIEAFDAHYDAERVAELIRTSDPEDFSNELLVTVCELGAVLGHVMLQVEPRLLWVPEWPYWESALYDPITGNVIPPFHWAIKKFSDYAVDDGLVPKIGCMQHNLNSRDSDASNQA